MRERQRTTGGKLHHESRSSTTQYSSSSDLREASDSFNVLPSLPSDNAGSTIAKLTTSQSETFDRDEPMDVSTEKSPNAPPTRTQEEFPTAKARDNRLVSSIPLGVSTKMSSKLQPNDIQDTRHPQQVGLSSSESLAHNYQPPSPHTDGSPTSSSKQLAETPEKISKTPNTEVPIPNIELTASLKLTKATTAQSSSFRLSLKELRKLETCPEECATTKTHDISIDVDLDSDKDSLPLPSSLQLPEDLPSVENTRAPEDFPTNKKRGSSKSPSRAQPKKVHEGFLLQQQGRSSSNSHAQKYLSPSLRSRQADESSPGRPKHSETVEVASKSRQILETSKYRATTLYSKGSSSGFDYETSSNSNTTNRKNEELAEIRENEDKRCRFPLKVRREVETPQEEIEGGSSNNGMALEGNRDSNNDRLETRGLHLASSCRDTTTGNTDPKNDRLETRGGHLASSCREASTTSVLVKTESCRANLQESTLCDTTVQIDCLQGLMDPKGATEVLNLERITFQEAGGFESGFDGNSFRRLHTLRLIECDVEEDDSKWLQQWLRTLMARTTATLVKVFLDRTEGVDMDCIRSLITRNDKQQLDLAIRCLAVPSDILHFKSLRSLHLIDCICMDDAVASARLSTNMKSLFLWGALCQESAASFFRKALTPHHCLESLTMSISGGADLVCLGLPHLLQNTSLKKLEIAILGRVKSSTEEVTKIVNAVARSRLRRFSLATHRNVGDWAGADVVAKVLSNNKNIRYLRLFSHEWKKDRHDERLVRKL